MKIGYVALSGLRAVDPQLLALGMSLPAVVQRSQIVSAMPSLGLLYLAACTPPGHEQQYFEISDESALPAAVFECDLVALSALSAQALAAYQVALRLRAAGVRVVMGGLHASVEPAEALRYVDAVAIGEGERVWPALVERAARGESISGVFNADHYPPVDLATLPVPRYDLLNADKYQRFPVQTSRGCPWRCDFCASSVMLQQRYRRRPVEGVIRDIRYLKGMRRRLFVELADDNTFVDKSWGKELCRQLEPLRIKWFTETDISVADDPELLDLMRRAGCRQLLIGLESPDRDSLEGIELRSNFKARRWDSLGEAVRRIQQYGITVNGCFVLGLDGQRDDVFQQVLDFADRVPLFEVQITLLTPFPGTPLYDRLLGEDRILNPRRWDLCTLFDVNFLPRDMTVETLRAGFVWLAKRLYHPSAVARRQRAFFDQLASQRMTHGGR